MEEDFLTYLHDWKEEAYSSSGLTPIGKSKLILSRETLAGLEITSKLDSFLFICC